MTIIKLPKETTTCIHTHDTQNPSFEWMKSINSFIDSQALKMKSQQKLYRSNIKDNKLE